MEVRDGAVIVDIDERRDERPLTSTLGEIESVGSGGLVGSVSVMLASIEPGKETPGLDGIVTREDDRPVSDVMREDGRLVSSVIGESEVPVRLLISDAPGGRVVMDPRSADVEVRGFGAIEIALTTGVPSGPTLTERLAIKIAVLVPLRDVPDDESPSPFVKVQTPSV